MNHTEQKGAFCLLLYSLTAAAAFLLSDIMPDEKR